MKKTLQILYSFAFLFQSRPWTLWTTFKRWAYRSCATSGSLCRPIRTCWTSTSFTTRTRRRRRRNRVTFLRAQVMSNFKWTLLIVFLLNLFLMDQPRPLFDLFSAFFKQNTSFIRQICLNKYPSSIRCSKSPPITTRPGLPPICKVTFFKKWANPGLFVYFRSFQTQILQKKL